MPKLLFLTTLPFYPDASGGSEQSSLYLFKSLQQRGWEVEVLCGLRLRSPYFRRACWQALRRLQKPALCVKDQDLGYPCWRQLIKFSKEPQWLRCLEQRLQAYQPNVVLSHNGPAHPLVNYSLEQGYPTFYFARWLSKFEPDYQLPQALHVIANSPFTAAHLTPFTPKPVGVVLPFVHADQYRVQGRQPRYITFINPVPHKGLDVAIEVARRLPQEQFLFVKGKWASYSDKTVEQLLQPLSQLPNVTVWEHQQDMRQVYSVTEILLVPSQFVETFGRVVLEAQINGIPVVAADIGGLPYALGQGGVLVKAHQEPQAYVEALQQLRADPGLYHRLSDLAIQNSQRPEFDPQAQVNSFIDFVESRIQVAA